MLQAVVMTSITFGSRMPAGAPRCSLGGHGTRERLSAEAQRREGGSAMFDASVLFPEAVTLLDEVRRRELAEEMRRVAGYRRWLGPTQAADRVHRLRRNGHQAPLATGGSRCAAAA
jgi:hypothetical protein